MVSTLACPRCQTHVTVAPGEKPVCHNCGFGRRDGPPTGAPGLDPMHPGSDPAPTADPSSHEQPFETQHGGHGGYAFSGQPQHEAGYGQTPYGGSQYGQPSHDRPNGYAKAPVSEGAALAALLVNILVWPGIGTLIGGRVGSGITQLLLWLFGWVLVFTLIGAILGIPMLIAAWIWALVDAIQLMSESRQQPAQY